MQFTERKKVIVVKKHFKMYKDLACFEQRERGTPIIFMWMIIWNCLFLEMQMTVQYFFQGFFHSSHLVFLVCLLFFFPHLKKKIEIVYIRVYTLTHNTGRNLHKINQKVNSQNSVVRYWIPYLFCRPPQKGTLKLWLLLLISSLNQRKWNHQI